MDTNVNFEMTELEIQRSCLKTIVNMLILRKWLINDIEKYYKLLLDTNKNEDFIDTVNIICLNNYKVAIKFYNFKLNTFKDDKEINTFISKYPDYHKILIVIDITTKAKTQLLNSSGFEVFKISEIIRDISNHHLVPKHNLLNIEDSTKVMTEYNLKKKDMPRIFIDDIMARYLYAKKDDVIQIIRYSTSSGYSTLYRLVVSGSIYI